MKKKTGKSPKLRSFTCVICKKPFQNYFSPAEIRKGRGKACSMKCKRIHNGNQKRRDKFRECVVFG